jgi:tetratricopeptide (TPR) repeat protein
MNLTGNPDAMVINAARLEREGLIPEAIQAYEELLASWPGLPDCWYNLGLLQRKSGRFSEALKSYQEALERQVSEPEVVHLNRAVIFSDCLRQYAAAERELNKALRLNPDHVPALFNLANLHEDLGRRDQAAAVYEKILTLAPEDPEILARYAGLKSFLSADDPLIARLRAALAKTDITAGDRASIGFALGRALDACGAFNSAFEAYRTANRHSRESAGSSFRDYDLKFEEQFVDRLIAAFPAGARFDGPRMISQRTSPPHPIFVCGMFRSGSTLTEQLLAGHSQVTAGGELNFIPRAVRARLEPFPESMASVSPLLLETLAAEYLDMLAEVFPGCAYVTDKRPDNYMYIGLIKMLFPNAKIVLTTREPLDNCLSVYFLHLDQRMSYALDLMDIGHHYLQYLRLMNHWKALFGKDILELNYDALVKDPKPVVQETLAFLGLEWDEGCLAVPPAGRGIKTASVWQVREPLYQRSSGRSRHYERQLSALREYLNLSSDLGK